jgi:hypothetical protein
MDKNPSIKYTIDYRDVKHPRLEFKTGALMLILPKTDGNPEQTLEKYKNWIHKKEAIIKKALEEASTKDTVQTRTDKELRNLVNALAQNYQTELNTTINKVYFRKMKTKWASHSKKGNLTVNTLLEYLPNNLIEYIIYHETTHSLERKHNETFWRLMNKRFPDYEIKEKELLTYWFLIQETLKNPTSHKKF